MFLASSIAAFLLRDPPGAVPRRRPGRRRSGRRARPTSTREAPAVTEIDWDDESADKGGYETFMLKEIYEQPEAVRETIGDRVRGHKLAAREPGHGGRGDPQPPPGRDRRLRHRVPRRRRRPVRARGVGADPGRAGHRQRVDLPQPGALPGHARDRHLPVGRDPRHGQRDEPRPRAPARARSRSRT